MKTRIGVQDTHPDIEHMQTEMLRKAGPTERVRLARSLSQSVMQMAWRSLQKANPDADEDEIAVLFVALNYGQELAEGYRAALTQRRVQGR